MSVTESLPLLVVIGATGNQGGSVVSHYLSLSTPEYRIRGVTRNASSAASQTLAGKGVEMVTADLDDLPSLQRAFAGASVIFGATDFWGPYNDPKNQGKGKQNGMLQNEWAYHKEVEQCKNIFKAASSVPDLKRLIYSSLADTTAISNGKYQHVYHFASKAHALKFARNEYPELIAKTSVIQLGAYLSNWLGMPGLRPEKNPETDVYEFTNPFPAGYKLPLVAAEEDTGPFVAALFDLPAGQNLLAFREWMSIDEFMALWSKVLGKAVGIKDANVAPLPEGLDEDAMAFMQEMREGGEFCQEFGFAGQNVDKTVALPDKLEVPVNLPTVKDWIMKQDWSAVL